MVKRATAYISPADVQQKSEAWLGVLREGVRPRPWLELKPEKAALLIVDMIRYFASPDGPAWLPAAAAVIPQIEILLDRWRKANGAVAFTRHGHKGEDDLGMLGRFFTDWIRADSSDAQIIDELAPRPGEGVFGKTTYDAFHETGLQTWLHKRGVEQVLVTGVLTHMCVETTARAAFVRGFEVYIPVDGTATSSEALHLGSLAGLADAAAVLCSVDEVVKKCG